MIGLRQTVQFPNNPNRVTMHAHALACDRHLVFSASDKDDMSAMDRRSGAAGGGRETAGLGGGRGNAGLGGGRGNAGLGGGRGPTGPTRR